jgi:hypothetical protein
MLEHVGVFLRKLVANWSPHIMTRQTQLTHDQHTVPQWHLRKFVDLNGDLWRYKPNMPAKKSRPKSECCEFDFYEYELNGKKTNNYYENWLARIESDAAGLFQDVLNGKPIGQQKSVIWAVYVGSLFARSPKYRTQISATMVEKFKKHTQSPEYVRDLQYGLLQKGELVFASELQRVVERVRRNMEQSPSFYHLTGLDRHAAVLGEALMRKAWHTIQAPPGKFFVMSDCPVSSVELVGGQVKPGVGFAKEHAAIILPLTPEHLFVAASPLFQWKAVPDPVGVDSINLLTIQFAHERVYAHLNSPDIKRLVDCQINEVVFGQNAFLPGSSN